MSPFGYLLLAAFSSVIFIVLDAIKEEQQALSKKVDAIPPSYRPEVCLEIKTTPIFQN